MQVYKNLSGLSGVKDYEYDDRSITVRFKDKSKAGHDTYVYTYDSADMNRIENMKRLADSGMGLNSYIMREVRNYWETKR